ncbi:hypothetical protein EMCRGX_G022711 [Ephydatia muelleri]
MRSLCPYVTIVMPTKPAVLTQSIAAKPSPKPFVSKITSCHGNIVYTFLIFRRLHHKTCGSSSRCEDEDAKPVQTLLSKTTSQTKVVAKGSKAVTKAPPTTKPPVADSSDSSSSSEDEVKTTKPTPKPSVSKAPPTKPVDSSDSSSSSEDEDVVAKGDSKAVAKAPPTATPIKPPVTADSSDTSSSSEDEDLSDLLKLLELDKYKENFDEQEVDFETFLTMTEEDFKEIGVKTLGARRKLHIAICEIKRLRSQPPQKASYISSRTIRQQQQLQPSSSMSLGRMASMGGMRGVSHSMRM